MPTRLKLLSYLTSAVLVFGVVLRILYLDADPQYYEWIGYITDEGRWIYQAREFFLFHTSSRNDLYDIHIILAPLFQLVNYFIFNLIGLSGLSSRLFTAICGSALLLIFWKYLRHTVTPQALFVGLAFLAVQADFVALSRMAVPEMVIVFFQALAYFALLSREPTRRRMVMLGVLMLIAAGMKGTIVFFLGIFSLILLFMPRAADSSAGKPPNWQYLLWFWGGFAAPLLIPGAVWAACCAPEGFFSFSRFSASNNLTTIIGFLRLSDIYRIASFPFTDTLAPALNILALGLWLSWLGWIAADREEIDTRSRRYWVTSTIWIVAYLVLMLALDYFPQRYMVHIVLPMAINMTVGISLLQKAGIPKVLAALRRKDRMQLLRLAVFVLPSAVFFAPLLASAIALAGIDPDHFRVQLACLALSTAVTAGIVRQLTGREEILRFFVAFPLVQATLWAALLVAGVENASLWPTINGGPSRALYLGSIVLASMATAAAIYKRPVAATAVSRLVTIYAMGYVVTSMVRLAPAYLDPHYTIRDASRDLGAIAEGVPSIATFRAEGLFSDNALRYRRFDPGPAWSSNPPQVIVTVNGVRGSRGEILDQQYHLIKSYVPYISPEYSRVRPAAILPEIMVYKKNQ